MDILVCVCFATHWLGNEECGFDLESVSGDGTFKYLVE